MISCGARLAPFDIPQLREIMSYDELELDRMGDRRTATFFCISDTDSTYNFLVALAFSQMFNLLCERADNVHGGRLPHHVRVLWDEAANTGQVPNLEKLVAVIRSREISLCLLYQQLAQCKAIYDKNAETILGNMDSVLFLGGREASTIKEISENWLGKATISMQTEGRSRGQSESYSQNTQRLGRELMTPSELATMPGDRCILQLRGLPPFYSKKYDLKQHPNYRFTAEADKVKNAFDLDRLIDRRRRPGMNEECEVYEVSVPDETLTDEDEDILNYRKTVEEHPEMQESGAVSRYLQKQKIKRQYAKQAREAARQTAKAAEGTASVTGKLTEKVSAYIKEHPGGLLLLLAAFLLLVVLQSCMSSLVTVGNGVAGAIGASTYAAEDADLLGAEAAYCALEDELQRYLDTYTRTHDYDEYHFDLDTIEHDPYVLLSIVCALHEGEWTLDEVRGTLQMLFDRQYILTEDVVVERRYYLETDTWTDEDGNTHSDTYRVYYDYYICTVTLENFNLSHLPVYIMGEETLSRYALYMATLGNRPDLFPSSPYVGKYTSKPPAHEIPEDYLADETFAAILKEAEKYVGYPYVWGGSSPSTSFDCSGFVSYVYNQCGWDFGRLGAQGLYNISTRTSSPKPGDLVFFTGTYDTPGISHVGIYVGDGWMLHCGDPISYANLNTSYWQSHFYAYGKLF